MRFGSKQTSARRHRPQRRTIHHGSSRGEGWVDRFACGTAPTFPHSPEAQFPAQSKSVGRKTWR